MKQYPWYPTKKYGTFADFVSALPQFGEKPAVTEYDRQGQKATHSYAELYADVCALAQSLQAQGIAGQHTAIVGENSYAWIAAFLAVCSSGGVAVCIDIEQPDETIAQMLALADVQNVFASGSMIGLCRKIAEKNGDPERIFSLENEKMQALIHEAPDSDFSFPTLTPDQPAVIAFTSGTTAQAKAVLLSGRNLLSNAANASAVLDLGASTFSGLPFFHTYGLTCGVICSLLQGCHLTVNGNLRTMLRDLRLCNAETMFSVPLILEVVWKNVRQELEKQGELKNAERLLKICRLFGALGRKLTQKQREALHDKYFGALKTVICGGAHINTDISKTMDALGVAVLQGYGITECSPLIAVNRNEFHRPHTVGTVLPGWQIKFENDEILVCGESLMLGYYHDEEATSAVIKDGFFRTGDLGSFDPQGQLLIVGRTKNLIVLKNGKKISPERIEELILRIPLVKEAVVYGSVSGSVADDVKPAVSIFPDPQATAGMGRYEILNALQEKVNQINASLPTYQQIRMITLREKEFDKTGSKKNIRTGIGV